MAKRVNVDLVEPWTVSRLALNRTKVTNLVKSLLLRVTMDHKLIVNVHHRAFGNVILGRKIPSENPTNL